MRWISVITAVSLVGCIQTTSPGGTDTNIRYGTGGTSTTPEADVELHPSPHAMGIKDPCTPECEHYFAGQRYWKSHRHSRGCGHYYDETTGRWKANDRP